MAVEKIGDFQSMTRYISGTVPDSCFFVKLLVKLFCSDFQAVIGATLVAAFLLIGYILLYFSCCFNVR